jgi:glycosyltransferase involved in cell wall biosynthesis
MTGISVVIPTYNRCHSLERVLAALARQDVPASEFEVVVVDDGSTDATRQRLLEAQPPFRLKYAFQCNLGPAAARNCGVAQAQGATVVFLDDDVSPAPSLLSEHLRWHTAHGPGVVVIGPMLPPLDYPVAPWVQWSQERLLEQYRAMQAGEWEPTARQFYTGNASLARADFLASGGFDARYRRAEDIELAFRLSARGLRFVFNPAAIGYHYEERSFAAWLAIARAYGRSDVAFAVEKGQAWILPVILHEYGQRPWLVRLVTRLCLDRPRRQEAASAVLQWLAVVGHRLNWSLAVRAALSSLFNLQHYQGIAEGLGGRERFFGEVAAARKAASAAS